MKIVLFGPPGAGKGTQANLISGKYGLSHISTGEIIRRNIEKKTPVGLAAQHYIECGKLVPDEVVTELLKGELVADKGFLLDGYPRTLEQAKMLESITDVDIVINLMVDEEAVVDRIVNRLVCPVCGKNYNKKLHDKAVCTCGATLTTRADDTEEIVRERLNVYNKSTKPIIAYYKAKNKLVDIDGDGTIEEVFSRIQRVL